MKLKNKVALVTGASRGIGRKIAEDLASHGVKVALAARSVSAIEAAATYAKERSQFGKPIASYQLTQHKIGKMVVEVAAGRQLFDVRHTSQTFDIGRGHKRSGMRLLTVGTDTSCGKMFTALTLEKEMRDRGMKAEFRATGQTGIFIAGNGVAIDAVVSDFISGSVEWLCPENDPDHWDLVEGQGSIFHAGYAGVTLGLIHGSQPDVLVVCHDPGRPHMRGTPAIPVRSISEVIEATMEAARVTNPDVRCIGCAINTSKLSDAEAEAELQRARDETGLPAVDPVKHGVGVLVDAL